MSPAPIEVDRGPTRLRVAAVQMIFADSLSGNLAKIELAATRAADAARMRLFPDSPRPVTPTISAAQARGAAASGGCDDSRSGTFIYWWAAPSSRVGVCLMASSS